MTRGGRLLRGIYAEQREVLAMTAIVTKRVRCTPATAERLNRYKI